MIRLRHILESWNLQVGRLLLVLDFTNWLFYFDRGGAITHWGVAFGPTRIIWCRKTEVFR